MQNNELVDYRTVPDIDASLLPAEVTVADPRGSGPLQVDLQIVTSVNIREVMPMDIATTIFFVNDLTDGDEPIILSNALNIYNEEVGPGNIQSTYMPGRSVLMSRESICLQWQKLFSCSICEINSSVYPN